MTYLKTTSTGGVASDPVLVNDRARKNAASHGSEGLRLRLEWQFEKEAKRLGVPIADARLLCMNSVRL